MDIQALQKTLFRMQADPAFARRLLAEEGAAWASTGLGEAERALLAEVELAGVEADPGDRRRSQIAGNAASEFAGTLAAAGTVALEDLVDAFPCSEEFHRSVMEGGRLPEAFGAFAARRAREARQDEVGAVVALERELARLRRATLEPEPPLAPGELRLSRRATLLSLPDGTHEWVQALRAALDRGGVAPPAPTTPGTAGEETLLLVTRPAPSAHRLHELTVERLAPPADRLFALAREPLAASERAAFARAAGAEPADLEAFLADWIAEGVLRLG